MLAWTAAALAVLALVAAMAVMARSLKQTSWRHRLAHVALPASQLALAAFMLWRIVLFAYPTWLLALVVFTCFACAAGDVALTRALRKAENADAAAERNRLMEAQIVLQEEHRAHIEAEAQEARCVRVQLDKELAQVEALLVSGAYAEVPGGIERAAQALGSRASRFCEHRVVDALVTEKARVCEAEGVRLDAHLAVPEGLPFSDAELCALFGNMLDNAIRACEDVPADERLIALDAHVAGGFFLVDMRNSCSPAQEAQSLRGRFRRPAITEHGWGLSILRMLAERHNGTLHTERKGAEFNTSLALELVS